jgi:hypothetical protein
VEVLLRAASATNLEPDDAEILVDIVAKHLTLESFQRHVVENDLEEVALGFIFRSYIPRTPPSRLTSSASSQISTGFTSDEAPELARMRKTLITALADVSALPEFSRKHSGLDTPLMASLLKWLPATRPQLQLCACIMIGNLALADRVCIDMVSKHEIHRTLLHILDTSSDSQLLHSALGFLRNVAIPAQNKGPLGAAGAIESASRFLTTNSLPQLLQATLTQASTALTRQVIINTLPNISHILRPLSPDENSPAYSKTHLTLLLDTYHRLEEPAIKVEIMRIVAAILRCIYSTPPSKSQDQLLERLFSLHPGLATPLGDTVSDSRWPIIRSEGWFAMALMARTSSGAALLVSELQKPKVYVALQQTICVQSVIMPVEAATPISPATPMDISAAPTPTASGVAGVVNNKDVENAMVLVSELLKHDGLLGEGVEDGAEEMDIGERVVLRRAALEEMLVRGSKVEE